MQSLCSFSVGLYADVEDKKRVKLGMMGHVYHHVHKTHVFKNTNSDYM